MTKSGKLPKHSFGPTAQDVLSHSGNSEVYSAFESACRFLGFDNNIYYNFNVGIEAYDRHDLRFYHGLSHGQLTALAAEDETRKLARAAALKRAEKRYTKSVLTVGGWYHDAVYLQVDGGLHHTIEEILKQYVTFSSQEQHHAEIHNAARLSAVGKIVCDVFGFRPGQTIALSAEEDCPGGLNEFLSAIVAAHCLAGGKKLSRRQRKNIAAVAAVIEASIPFRPSSLFEGLYQRLKGVGLSAHKAKITVKGAVLLANHDVEGFCGGPISVNSTLEARFREYISGTWQLIPEANPGLREDNYTPALFCKAIRNSHSFTMIKLNHDNIFHSFRGVPNAEEMAVMREHAQHNLSLFDSYMSAKIASATIVEAIALSVDPRGETALRELVEGNKLPDQIKHRFEGDEELIHKFLVDRGVDAPMGWDSRQSPIAAYLMRTIGTKGIYDIVALAAKNRTSDVLDHHSFLEEVGDTHPEALRDIASSLMKVAIVQQMGAHAREHILTRRVGLLQQIRDDLRM